MEGDVSTETVWCPSCGAEYTAGMTACGDCGVPLVAERPRSRHAVEDHGWGWYRDEVDRTIQRARRVARLLQQLAFYLGVLEVLAFLVVVIASFTSDDYEAGVIAVGAIIYLPIAIIIPTAVWAFGALLDVQATRLDLAILEAELEEDEDAG